MSFIKKKDGFNLIELIVLVGIMVVVIVIAGSMSGRFAQRRSVDNLNRNISSTLQIAKLNALRQGVEYRAVFADCTQLNSANPDCPVCITYDDFNAGDNTITIAMERGNSNRGSTNWCVESSQTRRIQQATALDLSDITQTDPLRFIFNPNGTLVDSTGAILAQQIDIGVNPTSNAKIKRCGGITVTPFGRIGIIEGNWDGAKCKPIGGDNEPSPSPSP